MAVFIWGSGYSHFPESAPLGTGNNKLFAFYLAPGN
jgi:hypothetical protein